MKRKIIQKVLSILIISMIPCLSQAIDWDNWLSVDAWRNWANQKSNESEVQKPTEVEDTITEENVDPQEKEVSQNETKIDFYDTLKIKFCPDKYLIGDNATLKKHLNTLFQKNQNKAAVSFFISLERKNHNLAISILDSLAPDYRLAILLDSPPAFVAKILIDMRTNDFKGKTLSHWGSYTLQSTYFGSKKVDHAEIKGESVTLQYIIFLLFHNSANSSDFGKRAIALANILSYTTNDNLVSLLVYNNEEAAVKMGSQHKSCFGAVKSKGHCDEETTIFLPVDFISGLLNFMYKNKLISGKDLVTVLEAEFSINKERFQALVKQIDTTIMNEISINFSEDVHAFLPDDIIMNVVTYLEERENDVLQIVSQTESSKTIIIESDNSEDQNEKEDL